MHSPMTARAYSSRSRLRCLAWALLLASLSATGQSKPSPASPPGSLPVITPPVPVTGPSPWLMPRKDRFFTDSTKLKAFIDKVEKPQEKLEDFRMETEQTRVRVEQERGNNKISKENYSKDMSGYGESINLYRDLKKQDRGGSR